MQLISRRRMEERRNFPSRIVSLKEDLLHKGIRICLKLNVIIVKNLVTKRTNVVNERNIKREKNILPQLILMMNTLRSLEVTIISFIFFL